MTKLALQRTANGAYLAKWHGGGESVIVIGTLYDGQKWFAAANWTGAAPGPLDERPVGVISIDHRLIKSLTLLKSI